MEQAKPLRQLPRGWEWTNLSEIAEVLTGTTPPKDNPDNYGDFIPFVKPPELTNCVVASAKDNLSEKGSLIARTLPPMSVLVSCIGNLGKVGITKVPVAFNQQINAAVFSNCVNPLYGFYYLQTDYVKEELTKVASATTIPIVNKSKFELTKFALAPFPEQRRIVAKIEELFTKLDAGVEALQKAKVQLKRYRQSVLKAAVTGELTKEWREAHQDELEPASDLLARILKERREKWEADQLSKMQSAGKSPKNDDWKKKYQEPTAPAPSELPELPRHWTWTRLEQLLSIIKNGIGIKPNADEGIPILRISALRPMSVNLDDCRFLHENYEPIADYILEEGDLLFTRYNGNPALVGICGLVRNIQKLIVHPDKLIRGEVASKLSLPAFLQIVLNVGESREFLSRRARTTAGQTGISGSDLKSVPVPLAPYGEQETVVEEVERLLSIADAMEQTIEQSLKQAERLRQSILKRAFEGKLVPQDPEDEPAEVLLARIREERERKAKAAPKRKVGRRGRAAQAAFFD